MGGRKDATLFMQQREGALVWQCCCGLLPLKVEFGSGPREDASKFLLLLESLVAQYTIVKPSLALALFVVVRMAAASGGNDRIINLAAFFKIIGFISIIIALAALLQAYSIFKSELHIFGHMKARFLAIKLPVLLITVQHIVTGLALNQWPSDPVKDEGGESVRLWLTLVLIEMPLYSLLLAVLFGEMQLGQGSTPFLPANLKQRARREDDAVDEAASPLHPVSVSLVEKISSSGLEDVRVGGGAEEYIEEGLPRNKGEERPSNSATEANGRASPARASQPSVSDKTSHSREVILLRSQTRPSSGCALWADVLSLWVLIPPTAADTGALTEPSAPPIQAQAAPPWGPARCQPPSSRARASSGVLSSTQHESHVCDAPRGTHQNSEQAVSSTRAVELSDIGPRSPPAGT